MLSSSGVTSHPQTAKPVNILVVDDEFGTRASLGTVLGLAGHHVVFAKDGDEALAIFERDPAKFRIIITDHQMFRVSGLDLVRNLREQGFAGEIALLTGYAGTADKDEYKKLNVTAIMEKPFDTAELRRWIESLA
jgi:CheY-like chemotaxis protein